MRLIINNKGLILKITVEKNEAKNITNGIAATLECRPPALALIAIPQLNKETIVIAKLIRNLLLYILSSTIFMIIFTHNAKLSGRPTGRSRLERLVMCFNCEM